MKSILRLSAALLVLVVFRSTSGFTQTTDELVQQGIEAHDAGEYAKALEWYNRALEQDPTNGNVLYEIGYTQYSMGEKNEALKSMEEAIRQLGPGENGHAFVVKGSIEDELGESKEALKTYKKGLKANPDFYLLHYNMAVTYNSMGSWEKAEEELVSAIQSNPTHASSHLLLGHIHANQNNRIKAMLPWYAALFMEQGTPRMNEACEKLMDASSFGVSRTSENSININLSLHDDKMDAMKSAELLVGLMIAAEKGKESSEFRKTDFDHFAAHTTLLFKTLNDSEAKGKEEEQIWWSFYQPLFDDIYKSGHTEAFCAFLSQHCSSNSKTWMEQHESDMQAFYEWANE